MEKASESLLKAIKEDSLSQELGVLKRREVEVRMLAPIIEALGNRFGRADVIETVRAEIVQIAAAQGQSLAKVSDDNASQAFFDTLSYWTQDDALEIEVLEHTDQVLSFDVRRCRYAELYQRMGVPELGDVLSCNRDYALIQGFNPDARLRRTQTIMQGAGYCDFRYTFPPSNIEDHADDR